MTKTDYNIAGRLGAKCRTLPIKINKKVRGGEAQKLNVKKLPKVHRRTKSLLKYDRKPRSKKG